MPKNHPLGEKLIVNLPKVEEPKKGMIGFNVFIYPDRMEVSSGFVTIQNKKTKASVQREKDKEKADALKSKKTGEQIF